jgi:hypothetical protein
MSVSASTRGAGLIELLIALVAGMLVITLAFETFTRVAGTARGRTERVGMAANAKAGATLLRREWEMLGADSLSGADLAAVSTSSALYRSFHGFGVLCRLVPDTLDVAAESLLLIRQPSPGRDTVLLYAPGDSVQVADAWLPLPLLSVATGAVCPGGLPGQRWLTHLDGAVVDRFHLHSGAPVKLFETREIRLYRSSGVWTVGVEDRSAGAAVQPLLAPMMPNGMALRLLDSSGTATADVRRARSLEVELQMVTGRDLGVGFGQSRGPSRDSVTLLIPFRNAP